MVQAWSNNATHQTGLMTQHGVEWDFGVVGFGDRTVAICPDLPDDSGVAIPGSGKKNARFIAAAPDLLEACKEALETIGKYEYLVTADILMKAIHKATGQ